ncbi:AraC family transcriptional regulator [Oxalicibacterium faecigallinarum]|uniref:Transcriptional regulator n=1 Tax=Oxalicibacterium faecigallinarum TaxID=573741 RepID=A0A8J3ASR1_9BURK|nr:helix-turn-helix transcriptional regulator [Oxalicibacterium faecigallinarum]GGI19400.1 transcriptional regulator [Oxalicibacterium faecigallinarum]
MQLPEDVLTPASPIRAVAVDYVDKHVIAPHSHRCAQLLYAIHGVMRVEAEGGVWVVPPTRGVWLQPDVIHQIRMCGDVHMRTVFVAPDAVPHQQLRSCVLEVTPLMRELIVAAVDADFHDQESSRNWHLTQLLLQELRLVPVLPLYLPLPHDKRLRSFCVALMRAPDSTLTLDEWAARLHMSIRTLHRLFQNETGMRLGEWRRQARLLQALEQLAGGAKVLDVALDHGYKSQSAFAAMFRRQFGMPPSAFYK